MKPLTICTLVCDKDIQYLDSFLIDINTKIKNIDFDILIYDNRLNNYNLKLPINCKIIGSNSNNDPLMLSRIRLIEQSNSEYIWFIDVDDSIATISLDSINDLKKDLIFISYKVDFNYCSLYYIYRSVGMNKRAIESMTHMGIWQVIFKKSLFDKSCINETQLSLCVSEDEILKKCIVSKSKSVAYLDDVVYTYNNKYSNDNAYLKLCNLLKSISIYNNKLPISSYFCNWVLCYDNDITTKVDMISKLCDFFGEEETKDFLRHSLLKPYDAIPLDIFKKDIESYNLFFDETIELNKDYYSTQSDFSLITILLDYGERELDELLDEIYRIPISNKIIIITDRNIISNNKISYVYFSEKKDYLTAYKNIVLNNTKDNEYIWLLPSTSYIQYIQTIPELTSNVVCINNEDLLDSTNIILYYLWVKSNYLKNQLKTLDIFDNWIYFLNRTLIDNIGQYFHTMNNIYFFCYSNYHYNTSNYFKEYERFFQNNKIVSSVFLYFFNEPLYLKYIKPLVDEYKPIQSSSSIDLTIATIICDKDAKHLEDLINLIKKNICSVSYEILVYDNRTKIENLENLDCSFIGSNGKNESIILARKRLSLKAKGKYIWYIDSDDTINKCDIKNILKSNSDMYIFSQYKDKVVYNTVNDTIINYRMFDNYSLAYTFIKKDVLYLANNFISETDNLFLNEDNFVYLLCLLNSSKVELLSHNIYNYDKISSNFYGLNINTNLIYNDITNDTLFYRSLIIFDLPNFLPTSPLRKFLKNNKLDTVKCTIDKDFLINAYSSFTYYNGMFNDKLTLQEANILTNFVTITTNIPKSSNYIYTIHNRLCNLDLIKTLHIFNFNKVFDSPLNKYLLKMWETYNPGFKIVVHNDKDDDIINLLKKSPFIFDIKNGNYTDTIKTYIVCKVLYKYGGFAIKPNTLVTQSLESLYSTNINSYFSLYSENIFDGFKPFYSKLEEPFLLSVSNKILQKSSIIPSYGVLDVNSINISPSFFYIYDIQINNNSITLWGRQYRKIYFTKEQLSNNTKYINDKDVIIIAISPNSESDVVIDYTRINLFLSIEPIEISYKFCLYNVPNRLDYMEKDF